jgi:hypothetical protein
MRFFFATFLTTFGDAFLAVFFALDRFFTAMSLRA